jgi:hypothetical protein
MAFTFRHGNVAHYWIGRVAYILTVIGGIIVFVVGALTLLGVTSFPFNLVSTSVTLVGIPTNWLLVILGIIAMILAHRANHIISAIILILIGFVVGGLSVIAGILLIIGGIIGIIARFV